MKRIVGLLVLLGTLLMGAGLWWLLSKSPLSQTHLEAPLQQSQEIGVAQANLAGAVIVSTADGLAAVSPSNGNLLPLAGSFQKLKEPVLQLSASVDNHYWLIETREVTDVEPGQPTALQTGWYLVDWQQNKLQRLRETFDATDKYKTKQVVSNIWLSSTQVGLVFAPIPQSGENPPSQQFFDLAILDLPTLHIRELGAIQAKSATLLGGNPAIPQLFLAVEEAEDTTIISRQASSNQSTTIVADAQKYAYPYNAHHNQVSILTEKGLQILKLPSLDTLTELTSTNTYTMEQNTWFSADGKVVAIVERQSGEDPTAINKQVNFYSDSGAKLYSLALTNDGSSDSITIYLSGDGQTALVKRAISFASTQAPVAEDATQILYLVRVFEGTSQVLGNIPSSASILGVY